MKAPMQILKPRNWQDFESLCQRIFKSEWQDPHTKKNGRLGQAQQGVDVYGIPSGESKYFGVQCKGKDDWSNSTLTETEIRDEVEKAKNFSHPLKSYIVVTTGSKDNKLEKLERDINLKLRE